MARLLVENKKIQADFSDEELKELEMENGTELEIIKAKKGVYLLLEKAPQEKKPVQVQAPATHVPDELEQKITELLKKSHPKDLVEGKFEKTLSKGELDKFQQMLAQNKVEKFKTNPKYIKFVYHLKPQAEIPRTFEMKEKNPEEYTIENDGLMVFKNEALAQKLSQQYAEQIKNGTIRGTRSFTGFFYLIDSKLLEQTCGKVIETMKKNKLSSADDLSANLKITPMLARIACTFLGEEGALLEKRRDLFQIIE